LAPKPLRAPQRSVSLFIVIITPSVPAFCPRILFNPNESRLPSKKGVRREREETIDDKVGRDILMSKMKKIVLVNAFGVVGAILSLFIVPGKTPFSLWALLAFMSLAISNYVVLRSQPRIRKREASELATTAIIALGFLGLVVWVVSSVWGK
jgi:hypothetical protein